MHATKHQSARTVVTVSTARLDMPGTLTLNHGRICGVCEGADLQCAAMRSVIRQRHAFLACSQRAPKVARRRHGDIPSQELPGTCVLCASPRSSSALGSAHCAPLARWVPDARCTAQLRA
jgi:hypothetical protein